MFVTSLLVVQLFLSEEPLLIQGDHPFEEVVWPRQGHEPEALLKAARTQTVLQAKLSEDTEWVDVEGNLDLDRSSVPAGMPFRRVGDPKFWEQYKLDNVADLIAEEFREGTITKWRSEKFEFPLDSTEAAAKCREIEAALATGKPIRSENLPLGATWHAGGTAKLKTATGRNVMLSFDIGYGFIIARDCSVKFGPKSR